MLFGHLSPFIFFLFLLQKVLFFLDISLVLILLTTAIYYFSSRLFFLYFSIKVQVIFLFFFPIFNIILHDFHIEIIIIPLVISALYQIQKKNYNKGLFYTSLIFLTKITLYPSIFSIAIYFFIHGKRKIFYSLSLILFLIFFTYYFFIRNEYIYGQNLGGDFIFQNVIKTIFNKSIINYFINFIIGVSIIFFSILIINFTKLKSKILWGLISPIFIYYLLSGNKNYLLNYYHYFYQFIPFLFFFSFNENTYSISLKQITLSILSFIFLSISPISLIYYTDIRDKFNVKDFFDTQKGIKTKELILNNVNFDKNTIISVSNSIVLDEYLNLKGVYPLGQDINGYILMPNKNEFGKFTKLKIDYYLIDKSTPYLLDKKINTSNYQEVISKYKKLFSLVYEDKNLLILNNEL